MKILLIANNFPPVVGGSAGVYHNICQQLGNCVTVVAPWRRYQDGSEVPGWRESDSRQPFRIERMELLHPVSPAAPSSIWSSTWRFVAEDLRLRRKVLRGALKVIDAFRPDVVCLGELYSLAWLGETLRQKRKLPIVHYIHGEEVTIGSGSRLYTQSAFAALRRAEGVVAVSRFTRDLLLQRDVRAERIHTITNGVDIERFTPGPKDCGIVARHGLETSRVILTVARVEERKGHDAVLRALQIIRKKIPDVKYVVAGEGSYLNRLRAMVGDLAVEKQVVFAGSIPDEQLANYYRTCDVFAMPNRRLANGDTEGFGLVFLEAGACGKPVVAGRDGGVPDAVTDGQTGFLVNGNSIEDVAVALTRLLSDESLAKRMGSKGREFAERASWPQKAAQFRTVCLEAIGKRTGSN